MKEEQQQILAVFVDFENLALGLKDRNDRFEIQRVLTRLLEKGNIVLKRAYADWKRYSAYVPSLHEAAIELIEVPVRRMTGKNSADMRLCVDAMDMSYSKPHINTFVVVSGDSDFSPLVSKLRENNKQVIGVGMKASTSDLLRDNCDEFIFYEDLTTEAQEAAVQLPDVDDQRKEAFRFLLEALDALTRENRDTLWSSMVKQTIKRKHPAFNEGAAGYRSFSRLLEDAEKLGLLTLTRDAADRSYIIVRAGSEPRRPDDGANGQQAPPRSRRTR